jgi:hypothetical protein
MHPVSSGQPVAMACWLNDRVGEVRSQLGLSDEGAVWALFFENPCGAPINACAIDDAIEQMDDTLIRTLANVIDEGPWAACLIMIPRRSGVPLAADHQFWSRLHESSQTSKLIGQVVVGESRYWSLRSTSFDLPQAQNSGCVAAEATSRCFRAGSQVPCAAPVAPSESAAPSA